MEKPALSPRVTSLSLRVPIYKIRILDQTLPSPKSASMLLKLYEEKQLSGIATYEKFNLSQAEILHLSRFYVMMGTDAI